MCFVTLFYFLFRCSFIDQDRIHREDTLGHRIENVLELRKIDAHVVDLVLIASAGM